MSGRIAIRIEPLQGHELLPVSADRVTLRWLGQAGFALRYGDFLALIDPYLSDSLAEKYRGCEFPHRRMMPPPVDPAAISGLSYVFCTHRHSDHMDPGTLPLLAANNHRCRFLVPRAESASALQAGIPEGRTDPVNAGEQLELAHDIRVEALPSAHETLKINEQGEHHFLGYVLQLGGLTLYHAGDCAPYAGLAEQLAKRRIDVALLPINGRDAYRQSHGVPGNFTAGEAVDLCRAARIPVMIAHHFGMFDFNTVDVAAVRAQFAAVSDVQCVLPEVDAVYTITTER